MTDSLLNDDTDHGARAEIEAKWKDKSKEELLAAKVESDLYVKTMERKSDQIMEDYKRVLDENRTSAKLQELIDRFEKLPQDHLVAQPEANEEQKPTYDPKEIESLVSNQIQKYESTKRQTANFEQVKNKLREAYGDNYPATLKQQIDSLGLSQEFVDNLARNHPEVLYRTLGLNQQQKSTNFQAPPTSRLRPDQFATNAPKRNWAYYEKLRKEKPEEYFNPKTTVQMHNDVLELGEDEFYK